MENSNRSVGFVGHGFSRVCGHRSGRPAVENRRRCIVSAQPGPFGSQAVDFVFSGGLLVILIGAGTLLWNGFTADITSTPNRTEGLNLPKVDRFNSSIDQSKSDEEKKDD